MVVGPRQKRHASCMLLPFYASETAVSTQSCVPSRGALPYLQVLATSLLSCAWTGEEEDWACLHSSQTSQPPQIQLFSSGISSPAGFGTTERMLREDILHFLPRTPPLALPAFRLFLASYLLPSAPTSLALGGRGGRGTHACLLPTMPNFSLGTRQNIRGSPQKETLHIRTWEGGPSAAPLLSSLTDSSQNLFSPSFVHAYARFCINSNM